MLRLTMQIEEMVGTNMVTIKLDSLMVRTEESIEKFNNMAEKCVSFLKEEQLHKKTE